MSSYGDECSSIWSQDDSVSSATTPASTPHEVSEFEATHYYAGIGAKGQGPLLIYRDSADVFEGPSGPEAYGRVMRLVPVPDNHEFGRDGMWDKIRDHVVALLNKQEISTTSVDFVRFTWLKAAQETEEDEDEDDEDDVKNNNDDNDDDVKEDEDSYDDTAPVEYGERYYTNPTIWIGVVPDTLSGAVAHKSCVEIRTYLDSLNVKNVDIAYRESIYKLLSGHGPTLFPPAEDGNALKDVIDNVSVLLSLPIAGRKTTMQGTMGPYFHVGNTLYATTARHNLFSLDGNNETYRYHISAPKKEVLLMGTPAFANYLASIQRRISNDIEAAELFEKQNTTLRNKIQSGINVAASQTKLHENEAELTKTRVRIDAVKNFFIQIKKNWSRDRDRVIGFVRWAPPIGVGVPPHRYTRDLCVVELYKEKFRNLMGNILSLGPERPAAEFMDLMYQRTDVLSEFKYPDHGVMPLGSMLTAQQVNNPNSLNLQGDHVRRVIKRGFTTNTTIGSLSGFMSFVRKYFPTGNIESLEVPILSHENDTGTFSKRGDSGALIISATGEFVAGLTGGTDKGTDSSDITFGTLFEWTRKLIKEEFPGANFHFKNIEEFLADTSV